MNQIIIKGAKENNLKNIDLTIPRNKIVCFVGVSGSGKSTIAFDIIAKEGQRQYFESLSSLARRYLAKNNRPDVEEIKGISSTVIISQDRLHPSPRSTVGTVTETYTYLRLLYSRSGWPTFDSSYFSFNHPLGACPRCKGVGRAMDIDVTKLIDVNKSLNEGAILYSNWRVKSMYWKIIRSTEFFDMDKKVKDFTSDEFNKLMYAPKQRAHNNDDGVVMPMYQGIVTHLNSRGSSVSRGVNEDELKYFNYIDCPECHGWKLKKESLGVTLNGKNIGQVANMPISEAYDFIKSIEHKNATVIKPRILEQLKFLVDAGVGYLSLNRSTNTLSGGEAQRVKLARQLGCDLIETIYVMDEPTSGLHPRDLELVVKNLERLRDGGNSVLVVEHDESVIRSADYIVEVGQGGGKKGGEIVFSGSKDDLLKSNTLTAKYLNRSNKVISNSSRKPTGTLKIVSASRNNLKDVSVDIPTGQLVALTGVSGAGKSSLVDEIMSQHSDKVVLIGQGAIGNNRRGSIATYVGVFDEIRELFARQNKVSASLFSYNSKQGYCIECEGLGFIDMDMNFLGNVRTKCDKCGGKRYKPEVLDYKYSGKDISEILEMTAVEAIDFFDQDNIKNGLRMLLDVGLDYVELGQTLDTLSGGEGQRLKLASRLQNKGEFYILDEPTSGLHFADVEKLMALLNKLVDNGNTVFVIEHNLEVIRQADWIIDMGPEGGDKGGEIVAQGTINNIKDCKRSWTGKYL
ncbi:excinuclease ABC subunit UvrA [Candidatus Shapirobacteria bacterium]|nr:excinuclease ABC subunit UvrA [Candidatus Shapirobacteria bacterium]